MDLVLAILAALLALLGIVGAVVPVLPGPLISFVGLLCVALTSGSGVTA